jgi:hypothetical protein
LCACDVQHVQATHQDDKGSSKHYLINKQNYFLPWQEPKPSLPPAQNELVGMLHTFQLFVDKM